MMDLFEKPHFPKATRTHIVGADGPYVRRNRKGPIPTWLKERVRKAWLTGAFTLSDLAIEHDIHTHVAKKIIKGLQRPKM